MRALRLAATFLRFGVLNELQYRANFFVAAFQSLLAVAVGLAVLALVYSHTTLAERLDAVGAARRSSACRSCSAASCTR